MGSVGLVFFDWIARHLRLISGVDVEGVFGSY